MDIPLLRQLLALCCYVVCMGFCFCDGFGLANWKKILWFGLLVALSAYSLEKTGEFDLALILGAGSIGALALGWIEVRRRKGR